MKLSFYYVLTRTNELHIALEYVPKLRQFVDGGGTNETTDLCKAQRIEKQLAVRIALIGHGLKLDYLENLAALAWTILKEERTCTLIGEVQPHGNQHPRHHQRTARNHNVNGAVER